MYGETMYSAGFIYTAEDRKGYIPFQWKLNRDIHSPLATKATAFDTLDVFVDDSEVYFYGDGGRPSLVSSSSSDVRIYEARLVQAGASRDQKIRPEGLRALEYILSSATDAQLSAIRAGQVAWRSAVKFIVPSVDGHLARSDFLQFRMRDCPNVKSVSRFIQVGELFRSRDIAVNGFSEHSHGVNYVNGANGANGVNGNGGIGQSHPSIETLLATTIGACNLKSDEGADLEYSQRQLDLELTNRLSWPWLLPNPSSRKTLVVVEGRRHPAVSGAIEGILRAAMALDITLVLVDNEGHWLQKERFSHFRDKFIPVNMDLDEGLPDRIISALNEWGGHFDGVVTFADRFLVAVAKVNTKLNLQTGPVEGFETVVDKFKTRMLEPSERDSSAILNTYDELMKIKQLNSFSKSYPLIVKHPHGTASEGVYRVMNDQQLEEAVSCVLSPYFVNRYGRGVILEHYEDGPEIDLNMILLNGNILFSEISDDFPSAGDFTDGLDGTFAEVANIYPSNLPESEQEMMTSSIYNTLQRLGFHTGCYHIEARVRNSTMEYNFDDKDLDLRKKPARNDAEVPSMFMIEINGRSPGFEAANASEAAWGIDWYALQVLSVMGVSEHERLKSLAHPYLQGTQYFCEVLFWPAKYGGTFTSDDPFADIEARHPDISAHITRSRAFFKKGDIVPDPKSGPLLFLAYCVLGSTKSRDDVKRLARDLRREIRMVVED